eukprot:g47082.t1
MLSDFKYVLGFRARILENVDTLTTGGGQPIGDKLNVMTAGPRGPLLMQDTVFVDEMAHFDRERIPERVVHAKGAEQYERVMEQMWYIRVNNPWSPLCLGQTGGGPIVLGLIILYDTPLEQMGLQLRTSGPEVETLPLVRKGPNLVTNHLVPSCRTNSIKGYYSNVEKLQHAAVQRDLGVPVHESQKVGLQVEQELR